MTWAKGHEAEWMIYEEKMRRWNAAEPPHNKPRAPFQRGHHINTLPIEHNEPGSNLPEPVAGATP